MKIIAINASPRKTGNSAKMLDSWVEGYKSVYPSFLERTMFSKNTYHMNHESLAPKPVPVTMIYSCNCTLELAEKSLLPITGTTLRRR